MDRCRNVDRGDGWYQHRYAYEASSPLGNPIAKVPSVAYKAIYAAVNEEE